LRRKGDQGIGDFSTLAQVAEATARVGGALVGVNPLHALFPGDRSRASPYHPCDRRFLDPLYIDVTRIPGLEHSPEARSLLESRAGEAEALAAAREVDYAGTWALKKAVLEACHRSFERRPADDALARDFERFAADGGSALRHFACFNVIADEHRGAAWPTWPAGLSRPDAPGVASFAARHAREVRFVSYLQWLAERQLGEAAARGRSAGLALGLYRDLAVGSAPDGAEVWADPLAWAHGASIGAPPDHFSREGQVWSLPPPVPEALAAGGYAGFRGLVAANMRHAGALRIDHVMGLSRLFWVPDGANAAEGAYVRYPCDDLLASLALESARASCLVVGEDLGTVEDGLRERLARANVLSFRVLWFEREGEEFIAPSRYPSKAAACFSTHDLPTIAGWWAGADVAEKESLGFLDANRASRAREDRLAEKRALARAIEREGVAEGAPADAERPIDDETVAAIHRYLGASAAALALVQADDLAGETVALNLPGTDRERPNWRRKTGVDAAALWTTAVGARAAADLAARRGEDAVADGSPGADAG
jgi:glycogen operon protein